MEEATLIDFLKEEIVFFRELLSSFIAEEIAYKEANSLLVKTINLSQQELLSEIKNHRSKKIKMTRLQDDVERSTLAFLKEQLESLIEKLHFQKEKTSYTKNTLPRLPLEEIQKPKLQVETLEEEC